MKKKLIIFLLLLTMAFTLSMGKKIFDISGCYSIEIPSNANFSWRVNNAMSMWKKFTTGYVTFPNGDYLFIQFEPPEVVLLTPQNKADISHIMTKYIEDHFELKKYYKYRNAKPIPIENGKRGVKLYIMGKNDSPQKSALIGLFYVYDMGKYAFFSHIYFERELKTVLKYKSVIDKILNSYTPHLHRNRHIESALLGKWSGGGGGTISTYGSTSSSLMVGSSDFFNFLPQNLVLTSHRMYAAYSENTDDYNFGSGVKGRKRLMRGNYFVYGNYRNRGLLVLILNGKISKSYYILLDKNNRAMYINFSSEYHRK